MTTTTDFWLGKRVFITGHTGFKGSWLCLWLDKLGAKVTGYSLSPPTNPNLFELANVNSRVTTIIGDVRDHDNLVKAIGENKPEIIIHMAAQPLVRDSYKNPVETYAINVMGTVNLMDALRLNPGIKAVVNVTTDKCYENREWVWGYRENEPMGGFDPYSNSKGCSELATSAFRNSFFNPTDYNKHGVAIASARAGNVIGGGDWAADRLIPDCMNSLLAEKQIILRNPQSTRPWQFVLEPLCGYLMLAERLFTNGPEYCGGWNFGPDDCDVRPVEAIVKYLCSAWGGTASYTIDKSVQPHEAKYLKLDCSKAKTKLGWQPQWRLEKALELIIEWYKNYEAKRDIRELCEKQIALFENSKPNGIVKCK